jgi:uncharacterized phiE125 gp8 family phage protein
MNDAIPWIYGTDRNGERFDVRWARTVDATTEPLTLQDAKDQLRYTQTDVDPVVYRYIRAARNAAEDARNCGLLTQTWVMNCRQFADVIWLPMAAPLQSVTSVQYYDTTGTQQTLAGTFYTVDTVSRPGRIVRAPLQSWPALQGDRLVNAITITYVVGYTTADLIPERVKQGMRIYLSLLDSDRDGLDPNNERARAAAYACWADRVETPEPRPITWRPTWLV